MNSAIRKARSVPHLCRAFGKNLTQIRDPQTPFAHKPFIPDPKSIHTHSQATQQRASNISPPISNLLINGGNWDSLTTGFASIELTDALVESVLLNLKEPTNAKKALLFFHWLSQCRQFKHPIRTYCITVHILVRAGLLIDTRALVESAISKNLESGSSRILVAETLSITFEATDSSPRVFDLLIQTYAKMRMIDEAFDACRLFGDRGFASSLISFNTMLHVAQKSDRNDLAWKLYEHMIEKRVYPNQASVETMINVMCKEGTLQRMVAVLDRIRGKRCSPVVIVSTSMAFKILDENRIEDGIMLLNRLLQNNMAVDVVVHSLIIFGRCKIGEFKLACKLHDEMLSRGYSSNAFVYTAFIRAHCKEGRINEGFRLMREMQSVGLNSYDDTYSLMIEGCSRSGRVKESLVLYEDMIRKGFLPGCVACNELMGRLCESGEVDKADDILTVLLDKGFVANQDTYLRLMDGFGKTGKAQKILKLYYEMEHKGLNLGEEVYTSLIENLGRCGKLKEAEKFRTIWNLLRKG